MARRISSHLSVATAVVATAVALAGLVTCGNGDKPSDPEGPPMPFSIDLVGLGDETSVKPNQSRPVVFVLHDATGQPLPGRTMQLLIVDGALAKGATLSIDRGVTDAVGQVPVQVIAGQPTTFIVRASAQGAPDRDLKITVDVQDMGQVAVLPDLLGNTAFLGLNVSVVQVALFENMGCAAIKRGARLDPKVDPKIDIRSTTLGKEIRYGSVPAAGGHAVLGQGLDAAGVLVVEGCVDLSGLSIMAETVVTVVLPLVPIEPSAIGRFSAVSHFRFPPEPLPQPQALRDLRALWRDLGACDLDPGRIWLDCTVDALAPVEGVNDPNDPLDCKPSAADEAVFDGRLTARRGLPVLTSKDGRCRQDFDGAGHASLEKQIAAMFAGNTQVVNDVRAVASEGSKLLEIFKVHSTIDVTATSQPGRLQIDHSLKQLEVGFGSENVLVNLPGLGTPSPSAHFITADVTRTDVTIARHGFTMRLGSATRTGFLSGALMKRGYDSDPTKFIAQIFSIASYFDRGTTYKGCPALSALVCPLVGGADGCLTAACGKGMMTLGKSLGDSFAALDGDDLDFFLEGAAPLLDPDGDGEVDAIGYLLPSPGVWKALIRLKPEQFAISGFFAADRVGP
jgi:hypothetical protein